MTTVQTNRWGREETLSEGEFAARVAEDLAGLPYFVVTPKRRQPKPVAWVWHGGTVPVPRWELPDGERVAVDNFVAGATKPPGDSWVPLYDAEAILAERDFWQDRERDRDRENRRARRVAWLAIGVAAFAAAVVVLLLAVSP